MGKQTTLRYFSGQASPQEDAASQGASELF